MNARRLCVCAAATTATTLLAGLVRAQDRDDAPGDVEDPAKAAAVRVNSFEELYVDLSQRVGGEKAEAWRRRQFDLARPGVRQQWEAQTEFLSKSDARDIVKSLYDRKSSFYDVAVGRAGEGTELSDFNWMLGCVADARVARLYEMLRQGAEDEARRTCSQWFDESRTAAKAGWDIIIENRTAPPGAEPRVPDIHNYATHCIVLLGAQFHEPGEILSQLDRWRASTVPVKVRMALVDPQPTSTLWEFVARNGQPSNLFTIQVMLLLLEREGRLTPEVLEQAAELGMPEPIKASLMNWATPVDAGFFGQDAAGQYVVQELTVTRVWPMGEINNRERSQRVAGYLRGLLTPDAEAAEPTPAVSK